MLTSGIDFASLRVILKPAVLDAAGAVAKPEVAIGYGIFINAVITFIIVALVIFIVVKMINRARASMDAKLKKTAEAAPVPEIPADVALLTEIRDLLKKQN